MSTFVSVGNATQPFPRLLDAVARLAPLLPRPVVVQYGNSRFSDAACQGTRFLEMEAFLAQVRTAEVLIIHGGAGSIIHALQAGKVPIVVPRRAALGEHVDDHQSELAQALAAADKIVVVDDVERLGSVIQARRRDQRQAPTTPALVSAIRVVLETYARTGRA